MDLSFLPLELENIIQNYTAQMEHTEKYKKVMWDLLNETWHPDYEYEYIHWCKDMDKHETGILVGRSEVVYKKDFMLITYFNKEKLLTRTIKGFRGIDYMTEEDMELNDMRDIQDMLETSDED